MLGRIAAVAALALIIAAPAEAADFLSKRDARAEALRYAAPFVDMLDPNAAVRTHMEAPRFCRRLNRVTVRCDYWAKVGDRIVRSTVTVRLQKNGLYGHLLPLDIWALSEPS